MSTRTRKLVGSCSNGMLVQVTLELIFIIQNIFLSKWSTTKSRRAWNRALAFSKRVFGGNLNSMYREFRSWASITDTLRTSVSSSVSFCEVGMVSHFKGFPFSSNLKAF